MHVVVASGQAPGCRTGLVTEAIAQDWSSVEGFRAYLCGAPPMVEATTLLVRQMGVLPGLSCYLGYVDQIYAALYERHLLPPEARSLLTLDGWGEVAFQRGRYRFAALRVRNRLYWRQLATAAIDGQWRVASRLCLAPAMVAACSMGLVGRDATAGLDALATVILSVL